MVRLFFLVLTFLFTIDAVSAKYHQGISLYGTPKYTDNFSHYDYVNPNAPKGGVIKIGVVGTFDRLDPMGVQGTPAYGLNFLFPRLMSRAADEPFSMYGLLAEGVKIANDYSHVTFNLRPNATWHNGAPITAEDVVFTVHLWQTKGSPAMQNLYKSIIKAEKIGPYKVRLFFDKKHQNREAVLFASQMPIVSKTFYGAPCESTCFPMGGGPYRVAHVVPGRTIIYKRIPNHWAENLGVNKGRYNFDEIHVEYFRNKTALFEAFKKGKISIYTEEDPKQWYTGFNIPAVQNGLIQRQEAIHQHPVSIDVLAFNIRRPLFQNAHVRKALSLAFDFEWLNDKLYYQSLSRTHSYFENTDFAASNPLSLEVAEIVKKYQSKIPPEQFQEALDLEASQWPRDLRIRLTKAQNLLEKAGWKMVDGVLMNSKGQKFVFDVILPSPYYEKMILAWARNLQLLGIQTHVHILNPSQYNHLKQSHDFDVIFHSWHQKKIPGREIINYWSSQAAQSQGSENYPGIQDPLVDDFISKVLKAKNYNQLISHAQVLDRILRSNYYTLPLTHMKKDYVAYWNTLDHPKLDPGMTAYYVSWWAKNP